MPSMITLVHSLSLVKNFHQMMVRATTQLCLQIPSRAIAHPRHHLRQFREIKHRPVIDSVGTGMCYCRLAELTFLKKFDDPGHAPIFTNKWSFLFQYCSTKTKTIKLMPFIGPSAALPTHRVFGGTRIRQRGVKSWWMLSSCVYESRKCVCYVDIGEGLSKRHKSNRPGFS